jgi:hypothetical protein
MKVVCAFVLSSLVGILGLYSLNRAQDTNLPGSKRLYQWSGNEGSISGQVTLKGKPPKLRIIDTSADPGCEIVSPELQTEEAIVADGRLANAVIYLKSGENLSEFLFAESDSPAVLAHKGCRYEPHVLAIRTGQLLTILNVDPTIHNTHPVPKNNVEYNWSQTAGSAGLSKSFARPETFIPFKDNQHPWEKAYVGVFSHPFFAVSDSRGEFSIRGIPPGHYTLVVWQELYGEQIVEVDVSPHDAKVLDFAFDASDQKWKL